MKALKFLVIAMGVLIVAGFGVIALTIATRMSDQRQERAGSGEAAGDEAPWRFDLPLPEGCRLADLQLNEERLLLRLEGPASLGCQDILLLDGDSGRILGRISPKTGAQ